MNEPAPTAAPSKAAKIWKRTWVGASLAGGLALVLWLASAVQSVWPVLGLSLVVLAVCIAEVDRMGSLRGRRLGWILGFTAVLVGLVVALSLRIDPGEMPPLSALDVCHGVLLASTWVAFVALLAAWSFARVDSWFVRAMAVGCAVANLAPIDGSVWLSFAGLALCFFLYARLILHGGRELRGESFAVVGCGAALLVSLPGLAVAWAAFGHWGLVALLVIAKLGDTAGYFVGVTLGRHRPFKSISPNKSIEGCAGSFVAGSLVGAGAVALGWLPNEPHGWLGGLAAGAVVNIAAQASDLLESWVKRKAGVKDSGTWFGPSGGMLDLVDSFFLATPVALIAWPLLFDFPPVRGLGE